MMHETKLRFLEHPTDSNDQQLFQVHPVLPTTRNPTLGPCIIFIIIIGYHSWEEHECIAIEEYECVG